MAPAAGPRRALLVLAAALLALGAWTAGPSARRPAEVPVADDPALEVRIDLNRSSVADLETLPGVGAALAARIAAHREAHGPFRSVDDLRLVTGIKAKLIDTLRPHVTVQPAPEPVPYLDLPSTRCPSHPGADFSVPARQGRSPRGGALVCAAQARRDPTQPGREKPSRVTRANG